MVEVGLCKVVLWPQLPHADASLVHRCGKKQHSLGVPLKGFRWHLLARKSLVSVGQESCCSPSKS